MSSTSINHVFDAMGLSESSTEIHDSDVSEVLTTTSDEASSAASTVEASASTSASEASATSASDASDVEVSDASATSDDEEVFDHECSSMDEASSEATEATATAPANKNKRKRRNPNRWMSEIKLAQRTTNLLIPEAPFRRLVKEIAQDYKTDLRFTQEAYHAVQTASEEYLIELYAASNNVAIHRGVITTAPKDMQMVLALNKTFKW